MPNKPTSRKPATRSAAKRSSRSTGGSASRSRARKTTGARRARSGTDILSLLKKDHDTVDKMFKSYDRMKEGDARKQALKEQILTELTVHAKAEEELFYPALRNALDAGAKGIELLDEAHVEHDTFKWLIAALEEEPGDEATTDARVKVLGEYVKHHVKEEEGEIFKTARKAGVDLAQLGSEFEARKRELKGESSAMSGRALTSGNGGNLAAR